MKGKKLFNFFEPILLMLAFVVGYLPYVIRCMLYELSISIPFKIGVAIRFILLKSMLKSIGKNVYVGRYVKIKNFKSLSLGDNVSIHEFSYIDALGGIKIGNNVSIAHSSSIVSFEHTYQDNFSPIKYNDLLLRKIEISDDVWVGCGVRLLSGCTIKHRVIIAAGAVVNSNQLESNAIYAGVPARKVKEI